MRSFSSSRQLQYCAARAKRSRFNPRGGCLGTGGNLKRGNFKQKNTAQAGELGRDQYAANFRAI